ncbi:universal stress protein [Maridesulfovibrio sp.]|uniref:universal stress protein n=1 Tax=Maridesulfovibrio sp. TaxID=2795000 RepID=UPI0029CA94D0|nr:universal stress protein [Maridesulfovibrio sp.]
MKILIPVDENTYSMYAIRHAARLARNTWPDLALLGIDQKGLLPGIEPNFTDSNPKVRMLHNYCKDLLALLGSNSELYVAGDEQFLMSEQGNRLAGEDHAGRKKLQLHLRNASPVKAILEEAKNNDSDLIIMGCSRSGSAWENDAHAPGKVADRANCPVLIIKDEHPITKIVCCLDHAHVTQESLEMISQLVTFYDAELEIVGILKHSQLKHEVEQQMGEVLDYYLKRNICALVKVVDEKSLESFISSGTQKNLMAVWLSPKSTLQRLFPRDKVATLVNNTLSSLLVLR